MKSTIEIRKTLELDHLDVSLHLDGTEVAIALAAMTDVEMEVMRIAERPDATIFPRLDALATLQGRIEMSPVRT